jgi:hypothetical protein
MALVQADLVQELQQPRRSLPAVVPAGATERLVQAVAHELPGSREAYRYRGCRRSAAMCDRTVVMSHRPG